MNHHFLSFRVGCHFVQSREDKARFTTYYISFRVVLSLERRYWFPLLGNKVSKSHYGDQPV